jgi:hypothetical protein
MSVRCSICQHPQCNSIDVSLVRDGTRSTARQFQVSRPALDRHKRHISQTATVAQVREIASSGEGTASLLVRVEGSIRYCESALKQAANNMDFPGVMRAIRELRGCLELLARLESESQRSGQRTGVGSRPPQNRERVRSPLPEVIGRLLQKIRLRQSRSLASIGATPKLEGLDLDMYASIPGG